MKRILLAMLVLVTCAAEAAAQNKSKKLALDLFAGAIGAFYPDPNSPNPEDKKEATGWDAGVSVRFIPWLSLTSAFGRHTYQENIPSYHFVVGPRVASPWSELGSRFIAHALVGFAHRGAGVTANGQAPAENTAEVVLGGGLDLFLFLRLQADYVRLDFSGVQKNNLRGFIGGVVPLCFGASCTDSDGIKVR